MPFSPTRSRPVLVALLLGAAMSMAQAKDSHDEHGDKAAAKPATKAPEKSAPAKPADEVNLDDLRQRLATRMSAVSAEHGAPATVRVANKVAAPATGPRVALANVQPKAAELAAAHRAQSHEGAAHWDYGGPGGPEAWGELKPQYALCGTGQRQSPIDIRGGIKVDLSPIKFDYKPSGFSVIDNGHTVQANVGSGNAIEVNGRRYDLVQFHFHRPSEERINGRYYDMVAHLVHKDLDGRLAVVAVLLEQGRAHPAVQQVWNSLPLERNEELPAPAPMDLNQLLPEDKRYFTYMGSLTTPPCSEGVLWMVMKQPVQLSPDQLAVFARLYPMNARPIQQQGGRLIKESN
jgi:carbonic anhydrase